MRRTSLNNWYYPRRKGKEKKRKGKKKRKGEKKRRKKKKRKGIGQRWKGSGKARRKENEKYGLETPSSELKMIITIFLNIF